MTVLQASLHLAFGVALNSCLVISVLMLFVPSRKTESTDLLRSAIVDILTFFIMWCSLLITLLTIAAAFGLLNNRAAILAVFTALPLTLGIVRRPVISKLKQSAVDTSQTALVALRTLFLLKHARWFVALMGLVSLLLLAHRIFIPPTSWDALTYHLRYPAHWMQVGRLETLAEPVGDPSPTFYPLNGEIMYLWGLLSTDSDWWSAIAQIPFVIISIIAIIGIVSYCGGSYASGALAGLVWLSVPCLWRQTFEPGVDIILSAFYLTAFFFGLRFAKTGDHRDWYLSAASAGLMVGTKYIGAAMLLTLIPLVCYGLSCRMPSRHLMLIVKGTALLLVLGSYSYIRNLVSSGNPIMPMELQLGSLTVPGLRSSASYFQQNGSALSKLLWSPRAVLDWGVALPALLLVCVVGFYRSRHRNPMEDVIYLSLLMMTVICFFVIPYKDHMFFLNLNALTIILTTILFTYRLSRISVSTIMIAAIIVNIPPTLFYWVKSTIFSVDRYRSLVGLAAGLVFLAVIFGKLSMGIRYRKLLWPWVLIVGYLVMAATQSTYQSKKYELWEHTWSNVREAGHGLRKREDYAEMARSWAFVARATNDKPATIAYSGMNIPYPLMGSNWHNRVLFVPRTSHIDAWHYDWGFRAELLDVSGNVQAWKRNVSLLQVDYLCVYRQTDDNGLDGIFPIEARWAEGSPDLMSLAYSSAWVLIYTIQ